jgi:hypothetical protein
MGLRDFEMKSGECGELSWEPITCVDRRIGLEILQDAVHGASPDADVRVEEQENVTAEGPGTQVTRVRWPELLWVLRSVTGDSAPTSRVSSVELAEFLI